MTTTSFNWADLTKIDGGWRVKTNPAGTHYIDVLHMLVNCRLVTTPVDDPTGFDRFWCYNGNDFPAIIRTISAAIAWDGAIDTEPSGWVRNGQTGERRKPE